MYSSRTLYEQTINLIQMYAHHNQGKRSIEKEAEEDQFKDILLLMELLTSILSKDFIDLAPPDANAPDTGKFTTTIMETVFEIFALKKR